MPTSTDHLHTNLEEGVATVTIAYPPINLMTVQVFKELAALVEALATDDEVRAVVFRSADPDWFIAHFDVEAILRIPPDASPPTELSSFHQMCESLRTMSKPTIADIRGRCGGGGSEFALSCDMRFVTPSAVLSQPEVALGILPGGSGTVRLPRLVGRSRALEAILGCDDINADTADRWGWVNRVLSANEIGPFVDRLARRIASFPAHAVAAAKASVVRAESDIFEQLIAEGAAFQTMLGQNESQTLMRAFLKTGGQTPGGERRLGELVGEIGRSIGDDE